MTEEDPLEDMIVKTWGGCTLPIRPVGGAAGTAFLYNELLESTPDGDQVREWVLTATSLTRSELGEFRVRPELVEPAGAAADYLIVQEFDERWSRGTNAAVMSSGVLDDYAERKGFRWTMAQVTDGVAARAEELRVLSGEPHRAYALGHVTTALGTPGEGRPLAVAYSGVTRDPDGVVRWAGALPEGFTGAPVFLAQHRSGREFRLLCIGLIAGGDRNPTVATFDTIRKMIDRLGVGATPGVWERVTGLLRRRPR
ncbi:hypothetical protein [Catellatospora citrea]|uniref:hypothetical protein n=1 Tax=Catellatospora citrea TaxID=53366 RepID=UPI0011C34AE9|nr:hypothetical protein [Catellatospora citrea]